MLEKLSYLCIVSEYPPLLQSSYFEYLFTLYTFLKFDYYLDMHAFEQFNLGAA